MLLKLQECRVRWHNVVSASFMIRNGTRQGSVLSPYLYSRYIRDMLGAVANSQIGCKIANQFINILAYADDLVLIGYSPVMESSSGPFVSFIQ